MLKNAATFIFTMALIVVMGEGVVRIVCAIRPQYDIEMLRYAVELKSPQPTTRSDGQGVLTFRHKPDTTATLMGVDVTTNAMGLRDATPSHSSPRILVLGDSITMGWGVPRSSVLDRVAEGKLRQRYPDIEIVNAGIGNYNAASMSYFYRDLTRQMTFDAVVMYLSVNDMEGDPVVHNNYLVRQSLLAAFMSIRWHYFQLRFAGNRDLYDYYARMLSDAHGSWQHNLTEILAVQNTARVQRQHFLVILQPDLLDFESDTRLLKILDAIESQLRDHGIEVYNVYDGIPKTYLQPETGRALWVAPDDRHYNAIGHHFMGLQLATILEPLLAPSPSLGTAP